MCAVGLYDKSYYTGRGKQKDNAEELSDSLIEFQQMVIGGCTMDECLYAYHGTTLNKRQTKALDLIFKTTKPWMKGHVAGVLAEIIPNTRDKTFLAAAQLLMGDEPLIGERAGEIDGGDIHIHFDTQDAKA